MKAVVLVGGEGTRLRPLTHTAPKPLLPIANEPFLERQLDWLACHGIDEVVLSLGYLPDAFMHHFPTDRFGKVRLRYAVEATPRGTAGGIRFAARDIDERFVVCNGDVLTALDLTAMVAFHEASGAEATISLTRVDDPSAFGVVPTRPDGEVVGFIEKPPRDEAPTDWINAGTYVLEPSVLARIPDRVKVSIERETFPRMVETPGALFGYQSEVYWLDIGTPEKYLQAHRDVLEGVLGTPPVRGAIEHATGVWEQEDTEIDPAALLAGPTLCGRGAHVGTGARITSSTLGPEVVVEAGAMVSGAVVLQGARLEAGSQVVDSIVGPEAIIGAGSFVSELTIVGARAKLAAATHVAGGRIPPG